jgi:hypothetical protein
MWLPSSLLELPLPHRFNQKRDSGTCVSETLKMNNETQTNAERFARYQSIVNVLLSKDPFRKPEIYYALENAAVMAGFAKLRRRGIDHETTNKF